MPINFPTSPTNGQVYTVGSRSWTWSSANGTWDATSVTTGPQGIQGTTGTQGLTGLQGTTGGFSFTLGTNVQTFLTTPSSANLASALTDETGTGVNVFGTGPTISLPIIDNIKIGYTTTATAAGTTTLTSASNYKQYFTGTTTQTVVMPVTSTLALGVSYEIANNSTGTLTMNSSGGNAIGTLPGGMTAVLTCINTGVTTAAGWHYEYTSYDTITGTGANVFATSPTLVTPSIGVATGTSFNGITGLSSTTPIIEGVAAVGTATTAARADHVHPASGGDPTVTALLFGGM